MPDALLETIGTTSLVTLNRPHRLNAIGGTLLADLHQALQDAHRDTQTRVVVLTGAGRAFCAGDDLKEFAQQTESAHRVAQVCEDIQRITRDIMFGPKLVIGAMHGHAVGGGLEWLLNCDLVVASEDLIGFFPEMQLGHFVTGGVTHLLPQALGHQRTMELLVLGERLDAQRLASLGLVNRVVPQGEALPAALAMAEQVAARSPFAVSLLKKALIGRAGPPEALTPATGPLEQALQAEQQAAMACFAHPDTARRIEAWGRAAAG
jgi:enoyl-CoA hydratase/carnithine racemase